MPYVWDHRIWWQTCGEMGNNEESSSYRPRWALRATSHTRLRARDHYTSSTLIGGKGGAGPSSLHTTAWGTNGVCECKMDVKSTWIPTWHQMDHVSCMVTKYAVQVRTCTLPVLVQRSRTKYNNWIKNDVHPIINRGCHTSFLPFSEVGEWRCGTLSLNGGGPILGECKVNQAAKADIIKTWRDKDLKRLENIIFYSKHNIVFVSLYLALYMNVVHVRTLSTYCTFVPRTW